MDKFSEQTGVGTSFTVRGDKRELPPEVETGLLRICQESLNNVGKHAQATKVEVTVEFDTSAVILAIGDNGLGFVKKGRSKQGRKHQGFGLISMRERARGLGGTFEVQSNKGEGTLVRVTVPVR